MADFFKDLFNSIFTPGPTPTLVVATNVAFASLQVVLLMLLLGTRSVHFAVLSTLCAGLWIAINWFVREINGLQAAQGSDSQTRQQQQQQLGPHHHKAEEKSGRGRDGAGASAVTTAREQVRTFDGAAVDSEDTETEEAVGRSTASLSVRQMGQSLDSSTSGLSVMSLDDPRKRRSTGDISGTDSEWDKLESEGER